MQQSGTLDENVVSVESPVKKGEMKENLSRNQNQPQAGQRPGVSLLTNTITSFLILADAPMQKQKSPKSRREPAPQCCNRQFKSWPQK